MERSICYQKSGALIGRKAQVLFVGEGTNGNGYMTIAYLDTQRLCYECNPDNYLLWHEFIKTDYMPSEKLTYKWLERILLWPELKISEKTYLIIGVDDKVPYLVMQTLIKRKILQYGGTLGRILKKNGRTYKNFKIEMYAAGKHCPNQSVTLYELLNA